MDARWYIYKDGRSQGPMTAAEIRDGLRDGSFDPFDLVAREGSNVRVELVEVDEIFVNNKVVYGEGGEAGAALQANVATTLSDELASGAIPADGEGTKRNAMSADLRMGNGHLALADGSSGDDTGGRGNRPPRSFHPSYAPGGGSGYDGGSDSGLQQQRSRREPKSYHVMDGRGRVLGPISAREIQALFFKGVLDSSVVVMKNGSGSRVRVDKFVAVYSQQRGGRPAGDGAAGGGSPHPSMPGGLQTRGPLNTRQVVAAARLERQRLTQVAYALAALLMALAAIVVWRSAGDAWFAKTWGRVDALREVVEEAPQSRPKVKLEASPKAKLTKNRDGRKAKVVRLEREAEASRQRMRQIERRKLEQAKKKQVERRKEERKQELLAERRKEERKREQLVERHRQEVEKRRLAQRRRIDAEWRNRERIEAIRKQREASKAKLAKKTLGSKPKAAAAPGKAPKSGGPQVSALADGQQVSRLGPMRFDRAQVEGCEAACSVTFSGAGGAVTAKFFKGVWGPILLSKSGGVYLSGLVRKSGEGTTIILSNIQ